MSKRGIECFDRELIDASEQALVQDWLPMEINQLSTGSYVGRYREIAFGDLSVIIETQNCDVQKRGVMDERFCTVSYARTSGSSTRISEHLADNSSLFFLPGGTEFDVQVEADIETVYFRFDQEFFLERAMVLDPRRWQQSLNGLQIFRSLNRCMLEAGVEHLFSCNPLMQSKQNGRFITDQLLLYLSSASSPDSDIPGLKARRRAVRLIGEVNEYLEASFDVQFCPSVVDICGEIRVSQRTLQYSFKSLLGVSPTAYLRIRRLNRARVQLISPSRSDLRVTDVAMQWHFWHLGKFSSDYAVLFGESPSVTLRRAFT